MSERKKRRVPSLSDIDESDRFILAESEPVEIASGCSISVEYDRNGKPLIRVKRYGNVKTKGLRREIERSYPGATILGLDKQVLMEKPECQSGEKKRPTKISGRNSAEKNAENHQSR